MIIMLMPTSPKESKYCLLLWQEKNGACCNEVWGAGDTFLWYWLFVEKFLINDSWMTFYFVGLFEIGHSPYYLCPGRGGPGKTRFKQ